MLLADSHRMVDKLENALREVFNWLPELVGALVILVVGYIVAKIVGRVLGGLLHRAGVDRALHSGQGGQLIAKVTSSPSRLVGRIAFWAVFLGAVSLAVSVLGIEALTAFMSEIFAYLPNVAAALLIFLAAGAIATGVAGLVSRTMGDTPTGNVIRTVGPGLVMAIAIFMILNQLRIAPEIVTITYAALVGAFALGAALAFGLGGRDIAARLLESAYQKGQESKEQVRQDLQQGKQRGMEQMSEAKDRVYAETR